MNILADQRSQEPRDRFPIYLQHEHWTRQQLKAYQAQALHACREYAYTHSPFYQRFHQGFMDRPLQELPVLTKAMIMEHFDELVTDRAIHLQDVRQYLTHADVGSLFLDRYRIMATSGSTGQPAIFLYNQEEGGIVANSFTRFQLWGGVTAKSKAAVVASSLPAHMTSNFPIVVDGQQVPRLQLSSNDQREMLVQKLNEWQPDVLFPYPSIASVLAQEYQQGRLHIAPRSIFCSAETLTDENRRFIEETWQTKLFHVYGTTEAGVLAAECSFHNGLHLFEDFSLIEVVDKNNNPVAPGEQGEKVLITILFRRTQPLIRYELSDLACLSTNEQCACGRPFALLESVGGRTSDSLYLQSLAGREEGVTPLQFQTVFDTLHVSGWQVVQEHDGLQIFLSGASQELRDEDVLDALRKALSKRGLQVPAMQVYRVASLTRSASGKAPMLISHVPRHTS